MTENLRTVPYGAGHAWHDKESTMGPLEESGFRTTTEEPQVIGPNRNYFTLPDSTNGVMLQFFDRRADG